ncbi:MAG: hypothetical protein JWQ54_4631 [Mucilaginibacter sp.]|nr:hypothetical protein [Mucilaginibacter sp.]
MLTCFSTPSIKVCGRYVYYQANENVLWGADPTSWRTT